MAEPLRRLINIERFDALQDKLTQWLQSYQVNSSDKNVRRCCELIELNSKMQLELLHVLGLSVSQGSLQEGANTAQVSPWLSQALISSDRDGCLASVNKDDLVTDKEMSRLQQSYDRSLQVLGNDLRIARSEADYLQNKMEKTRDELNSVKHQTSNEKTAIEMEAQEMQQRLSFLTHELTIIKSGGSSWKACDSEVGKREEKVAQRTSRSGHLSDGVSMESCAYGQAPVCLSRLIIPNALHDSSQRLRQEHLIERFLEMQIIDRQTAMNSLGAYIDNKEERQHVLFQVLQEAFAAAKLAFANYEMKVRSTVVPEHSGSRSVEEVVQNYISRNPDDYNLTRLVSDVMRAVRQRNSSPHIDSSLSCIEFFIREACRLAWNMQALPRPLDITPAATHEVFDNQRYCRFYDSDRITPYYVEHHHIWPSLVQGLKVIVKGEVYTKRGAGTVNDSANRPTLHSDCNKRIFMQ